MSQPGNESAGRRYLAVHRGHQHAGHDDGHRETDSLRCLRLGGRLAQAGGRHAASLTFHGTLLAVLRTTLEGCPEDYARRRHFR